jgi:DNA-binding MarR family transcriptional regulator
MSKLPQHGTFFPLFHTYLDLGLSYHQAALVSYIDKWNRGGNECFASVEEIAKELRLTYITMRRVIDRSLAQGIITGSVGDKGRSRTLKIASSFLAKVEVEVAKQESKAEKVGAQNEQGMCSNRADHVLKVSRSSAQNEQLPRYNLDLIPRSNTNTNTEINLIWSEDKQAMVRVRR